MDTGSRIEPLAALPWSRVIMVWMVIMLLETANVAAREIFIASRLGGTNARWLGIGVSCVVMFAAAWLGMRWMKVSTRVRALAVGATWAALTLVLQLAIDRLMLSTVAFMLLAPLLVVLIRVREKTP